MEDGEYKSDLKLRKSMIYSELSPRIENPAHGLKNNHSISLSIHSMDFTDSINTRSRMLVKTPSYPKFIPDISMESVLETAARKKSHEETYRENSSAYRRLRANSSAIIKERIRQKELLKDVHPPVLTTKSLRPHIAEDFDFAGKIEDFNLPLDPLSVNPRRTGYSRGHIRTMLSLDTFGPNSSSVISTMREQASRPESPNVDRYRFNRTNELSSRTGSPHQKQAMVTTYDPRTLSASRCIESGSLGYFGTTLTLEDRLLNGPPLKSKEWFKQYSNSRKMEMDAKEERKKAMARRIESESEAAIERANIEMFEATLKQKLITIK